MPPRCPPSAYTSSGCSFSRRPGTMKDRGTQLGSSRRSPPPASSACCTWVRLSICGPRKRDGERATIPSRRRAASSAFRHAARVSRTETLPLVASGFRRKAAWLDARLPAEAGSHACTRPTMRHAQRDDIPRPPRGFHRKRPPPRDGPPRRRPHCRGSRQGDGNQSALDAALDVHRTLTVRRRPASRLRRRRRRPAAGRYRRPQSLPRHLRRPVGRRGARRPARARRGVGRSTTRCGAAAAP